MLFYWQKQPIIKRGSRLSWLLRFSRRRPLTALFVSTAVLAGSVPCMVFIGFVFVTFLVSFVLFVMAESRGRGTLCSRPSSLAASVLRGSLDCMSGCLLVGCELSARFSFQYGGTCWNGFPLLCGSLYTSQDKKHHLRILKLKEIYVKWLGVERC